MSLSGNAVLVSGGVGSFSKKFANMALREHNPKAIRVFSRGVFASTTDASKIQRQPKAHYPK